MKTDFEKIEVDPRFTKSLLASGAFPFVEISKVAQIESNRKEIYRPVYHLHKWWAQRLGSVFKAILLSLVHNNKNEMLSAFYNSHEIKGVTVFDPFMGSGTTIGEAIKLGMNAVGRDINPVAYNLVRIANLDFKKDNVEIAFRELKEKVGSTILDLYKTRDSKGQSATALYYFWVKEVDCPSCSHTTPLFTSRIFAKHAYPKKFPTAQSICTECWSINETKYDSVSVQCTNCRTQYNPQEGFSSGSKVTCQKCLHCIQISENIRATEKPPRHKMYAKLVLRDDGKKEYLPVDDLDRTLFDSAKGKLQKFKKPFPVGKLDHGYNTKQAINYNYTEWSQFFNERQVLAANLIAQEIDRLSCSEDIRQLFKLFLSGVLEFNNMFASYKGEGTGAVRHMFSHHVLKPEKTPLEANFWGTEKSSGSFSNLFKSRVLRAIEYKAEPFEPSVDGKIFLPQSIPTPFIFDSYSNFLKFEGQKVFISCGNSGKTDMLDKSVDFIVTDPPFFDNVNYSELADFFFVWHKHFGLYESPSVTTRSTSEVQHQDADIFSSRFETVLRECKRVLKSNGILAFSYHHSREEGWVSIAQALWNAGFSVEQTYPVVAEMANATPKNAAKEPITLDIIVVCKHTEDVFAQKQSMGFVDSAELQILEMQKDFLLSKNDKKIILKGSALVRASGFAKMADKVKDFENSMKVIEKHLG